MSFVPDPNRFDPSRLRIGQDKDKYVAPSKQREPISRPERLDTDEQKKDQFKRVLEEKEREAKGKTKKTTDEGENLLQLATQLAAAKKEGGPTPVIIPDEKALSVKEIQELMPDILEALEQEAQKALAQPGIAYADVSAAKEAEIASAATRARATAAALAEQMISGLQLIEKSDRTETVITLKYPPLFENVEIRITEFHTAKKEFNLTFLNLTDPDARALVETRANQEILRTQLFERGYVLHTITIEPKIELAEPGTFKEGSKSREDRQQEGDREERQPKK